ncbi:hypothetical protein M8J76_006484 [Diaphorina citri]|nr:hypothetical protein M8J75_000788 [Diaphorina citri]KAI5744910.1 hypothetical protein M8J76_006484 [Diaphorina citri]
MTDQAQNRVISTSVSQAPLNDSASSEEQSSPSPDSSRVPILQGYLSKWTNYIHGWQNRWIVLTNGTLSYYKSDTEAAHGCRGAISLSRATIKAHELDLCRFDISVNDCVWCLRAETEEDKQNWVDVLEGFKVESGYGSENNLTNSNKPDEHYIQSSECTEVLLDDEEIGQLRKELKLKLSELNTYKDILFNQVDKIQTFLDTAESPTKKVDNVQLNQHAESNSDPIDFRTESILFKDTTREALTSLSQCLELINRGDEMWGKRHKDATSRQKTMEGAAYSSLMKTSHISNREEENSNGTSILAEDEFYDAVESGSQNSEDLGSSRKSSIVSLIPAPSSATANHRLWPEIQKVVSDQIRYARMGLGKGQWQLFAEEGEMKMYRREEEIKGMVMDPLKACHVVKGVTGHEMCHYFFRPEYRNDWETTLEKMTVAETISEDTIIFWQIHKSIWPVTQRDAVFWSHMTQVPDPSDRDAQNIWIVVNNSTDLDAYPPNQGKYLRLFLTVCMLCQTLVTPPKQGTTITRQDIACKITYCSVVNPGGWTPSSLLRTIYKREYPKFLKRFTSYVIEQCKNKPIMY